jgi:hypothetical protein
MIKDKKQKNSSWLHEALNSKLCIQCATIIPPIQSTFCLEVDHPVGWCCSADCMIKWNEDNVGDIDALIRDIRDTSIPDTNHKKTNKLMKFCKKFITR